MSSYNASIDPARGAPLPTPTSTQQPASEWASSTLSALDSETVINDKQEPHKYTAPDFGTTSMSQSNSKSTEGQMSTATTPGYEVPGAFPRHAQQNLVASGNGETMTERASGIVDAAKEYVPGQKDVMKALESAGQMVGGYIPAGVENYLPESVKAYFPHTNGAQDNRSLPSQETSPNEHPSSRGGVGVLPGGPSETSVAKLPEERLQEEADMNRNTELTGGKYSTQDAHTSGANDSATNPTAAREFENAGVNPSNNTPNANPKAAGADLFPGPRGSRNEWNSLNQAPSGAPSADASTRSLYGSSVGPKTDDELDKPAKTEQPVSANQQLNTQARTHPLGHDNAKWGDVPLGEGYQKRLDENEEMNVGDMNKRSFTGRGSKTDNAGKKPGIEAIDSDRATTGHGGTMGSASGVANTGNTIGSASERLNDQDTLGSDSKTSETSDASGSALKKGPSPVGSKTSDTTKKPGFMDKIKGEVKVLSGKLGHNDEKVEEGRRMLGKN